ncbi:O-antigen ligase family protein [Patescibacteria group bacterium]|nr:O-antigen ligase family protein [Patescibacteria group bacterium]
MADTIIEYSFYLIVFFVPIIWFPVNYELFEFNKMILTYILATIIFGAWLFKAISEKKLYIKKTPLDFILLLFLVGNVLATIFSIDWHMSVFGYYSRFNGGLLSTITYIFLYYALVTHFDKEKVYKLIFIAFISSVVVAIYGILQHPNPLFRAEDGSFRGVDANYWDVNAEKRAFSFLGQPNWLAAYLSMFFFIGTSYILIFKKFWQKSLILLSVVLIFLGFTFTVSRGGTVGFIFGAITFIFFLFVRRPTIWEKITSKIPLIKRSIRVPNLGNNWFWIAALLISILMVNYFFGNAITKRGFDVEIETPSVTQLEIEGSQTTQIRLIVWRGAIDIFKNNPIFGTGVETFAISYYQHKPMEHNITSEWDFLYNKAHNEYLNTLSTTGIVGTLPYLALIIYFSYLAAIWLYKEPQNDNRFLILGLFAAYASYLVQNIFGFSVVIIALLFFLIPAIFFVLTQKGKPKFRTILSEKYFIFTVSNFGSILVGSLASILIVSLLLFSVNAWIADYFFAKGLSGGTGNEIYDNLQSAVRLRPDEPLYLSQLAVVEANLALEVDDEELSKQFEEDSLKHIEVALSIGPNNLGIWRDKLRVYFDLLKLDDKYFSDALTTAEKTGELAPTDAKLHYNLALFYLLDETDEGMQKSNETLEKVLGWRPLYHQARRQLVKNYIEQGKEKMAKDHLNFLLDEDPEDVKSLELLESLD